MKNIIGFTRNQQFIHISYNYKQLMQLNSLVFPAPPSSYTKELLFGELIYVPRIFNKTEIEFQDKIKKIKFPNQYGIKSPATDQIEDEKFQNNTSLIPETKHTNIPCLYLPYQNGGSSKLLIYFHANAEDVGRCYEQLDHIRSTIRINVLAPEYPAYGIYTKIKKGNYLSKKPKLEIDADADDMKCSAEQIQQDAESVYDFVLQNFNNIQEKDIVIYGRSMGSGPTIHLGSVRKPRAIITMSGYTSIRNVVHDKVSFLSALVSEHFNNLEKIKTITKETAVLLLHGKKDSLVPFQHSVDLKSNLSKDVLSEIILSDNMTHNEFDFYMDLIRPFFQFFMKIEFDTNPTKRIESLDLDEAFYLDHFFERSLQIQKLRDIKLSLPRNVTINLKPDERKSVRGNLGGTTQVVVNPKYSTWLEPGPNDEPQIMTDNNADDDYKSLYPKGKQVELPRFNDTTPSFNKQRMEMRGSALTPSSDMDWDDDSKEQDEGIIKSRKKFRKSPASRHKLADQITFDE